MKTYLINGGAGFVGSHFTKLIENKYVSDRIVVTDACIVDNITDLNSVISELIDYTNIDFESLFLKYKFDIVIDFIPEVQNVSNLHNLLECCKKYNVERFVQVSIEDVNDSQKRFITKSSCEQLTLSYYDMYNVPTIVVKSSNNFGPNQDRDKFIPNTINNAIQQNFVLITGDGKSNRDWLHVTDTCRAIDAILNFGKCGNVYDISSGRKIDDLTIVKTILKFFKLPLSLIEYTKKQDYYEYHFDNTEVKNLGWQPKIDFFYGLTDTIKWYQNKFEGENK